MKVNVIARTQGIINHTLKTPQIRKITNIFKHTDVKIAFKCDNTISQLSKPASRSHPTTPYVRPGIYSLSC